MAENITVPSRRKHPRRQFLRKLGVLYEGRYWVANGVEIGEGGLSFRLAQKLGEGKNLVVNFQVPEGGFISEQGEIRSLRDDLKPGVFLYGIFFRTLKFDAKREIRAYVSARTELEN
jgi:hypothetical protein